jgi:hypothetical protein
MFPPVMVFVGIRDQASGIRHRLLPDARSNAYARSDCDGLDYLIFGLNWLHKRRIVSFGILPISAKSENISAVSAFAALPGNQILTVFRTDAPLRKNGLQAVNPQICCERCLMPDS